MPISLSTKPVVGITLGDASGIGPEVILKALSSPSIRSLARYLVIGDGAVIKRTKENLKLELAFTKASDPPQINGETGLSLFDLPNLRKSPPLPGRLSKACGQAAIEYLEQAVKFAREGIIQALVTAPLNKEAVNLAGHRWPGHTEYLAHLTDTENFAMMLLTRRLKVVLVTTHLPLKEVSSYLTEENICQKIRLIRRSLPDYFGIKAGRIGVSALNPHGSEGGTFGDEEEKVIRPAVVQARKESREGSIDGPYPADTLFYRALKGEFDVVLAMYHDQGLIPIKMLGFEEGVNLTLGLPFVRTSPDHGTGFDIAGKGVANPRSMEEAIKLAVELTLRKLKKNGEIFRPALPG